MTPRTTGSPPAHPGLPGQHPARSPLCLVPPRASPLPSPLPPLPHATPAEWSPLFAERFEAREPCPGARLRRWGLPPVFAVGPRGHGHRPSHEPRVRGDPAARTHAPSSAVLCQQLAGARHRAARGRLLPCLGRPPGLGQGSCWEFTGAALSHSLEM